MSTGTRQAVFVVLNGLLLQLLVVSDSSLGQLYPFEGTGVDLSGILGNGEEQEAIDMESNEEPADGLVYLVDDSLPDREARQVDMDRLQELVESLRQSDERPLEALQLNRHLPSNEPIAAEGETSISGPINDPADFDVSLSQLTNSLNHWMPNTSNRSIFLDGLLSAYLEKQQKQLGNRLFHEQSSDHNNTLVVSKINQSGREYIEQPLGLMDHQYVQGGAGEGHQLLGPDGTFENIQVIKTDLAIPSYCDPPNPCPLGYTAADGCLEEFINSASFSREYQVKQKCSCDNEHSLFNCGEPPSSINKNNDLHNSDHQNIRVGGYEKQQKDADTIENHSKQLETLARAIQNRFGNLASVKSLIDSYSNPVY